MKLFKNINYIQRIFTLLICIVLLNNLITAKQVHSKANSSIDSSDIVAVVGNKIITGEDFIKSYSFGPTVLKKTGSAKSDYLQAMINEELLSHKLKDSELAKDPSIQKMLKLIEQELVVEELFKAEINSRIKVSEEEINEAVKNSFQKVKLNYFFSTDSAEAKNIYSKLLEGYSFSSVQDEYKILLPREEGTGTTDFISYGELEEPFNNIAFSLTPFQISEIISAQDGYYILQVVDKLSGITSPVDYQTQYKKFEKILYNKKGSELGRKFVKDFMDPKNISLDAKQFSLLVNELYPSFRADNDSSKNELTLLEKIEIFPADVLQNNLSENAEEAIVKFNGGSFTIKELFYHLSYRPLDLSSQNINEFAEKLRKAIGLTLRDIFMEKEGKERSYHKKPELISELESWQNKMMTDKYIQSVKKKNLASETEVKEYFNSNLHNVTTLDRIGHNLKIALSLSKTREELLNDVRKISEEIPVKINEENLSKIIVDEPKHGRLPEVKLFKLGLPYFKLAFPVPDIVWGADNLLTN